MKSKHPLLIHHFLLFLSAVAVVLTVNVQISHAQTTEIYSTSGTFTVPAGVTSVSVEAWGGGGAGGGQNQNSDGGGGGGGGAYSKKLSVTVVPGNSYDVVVGTGGIGVTGNGGSGGDSYFNSTTILLAKGGTGGQRSTGTPPVGGAGGSATLGVGDIKYSGGQGEKGRNNNTGQGGYGGSSAGTGANGFSGPQTWATITYPTVNTPTGGGQGGNGGDAGINGKAGISPGGGGGGSGDGGSKLGGNGAAGKVIVSYICSTYLISGVSGTNTCRYGTSTITISSTPSGLPVGTYTVTYNQVNPSVSGLTANMQVTTAGTGIFTASDFNNTGSSTITITSLSSGLGAGSTPLCNTLINSNNTASIIVTSAVPSLPGIIAGNVTPCEGSSQTYSVTNVAGVSYDWVFPAGWTQTGGGNSNSITVTVGPGSGNIRVTPSNVCGSGAARTMAVNVNNLSILGLPGSRCGAGTGTITLSATSSGTIKWYNSSGTYLASGNTFTTPVLSETTTYYAEATNGTCTTARIPITAYIIIPPSLSAGGGGTYCYGSDINLNSTYSGGDNVYWEGPNGYYSNLTNPVLSNVTPSMSGTYIVNSNALSGINLVVNGDFELGNTGFSSAYTNSNDLLPEGTYAVVANPNTVHADFASCADHSTSGNLHMVINGAVASGVNIWSQTVNVVPNTYYQFTYWIQSVVGNNPSELQLYVNGVSAGPVYTAITGTCNWSQFLYNWSSNSNTSAILELKNRNIVAGGNDFALDDIIFQHTCTASTSVNVTVNADVTSGSIAGAQSICRGETPVAFSSSAAGTGSGTITYEWETNASGSYVAIPGATAATYSPPALYSTTSYRRKTVSNSGGVTCYSGYSNVITITVNGPVANAGGPNYVCQSSNPSAIYLSGASFGGGATSAAWKIVSGGGSLSSTAQTTTPSIVTYTPAANYSGVVKLWLTTSGGGGCNAISERIINVIPSVTAVAGTVITTCSNSGAVNITAGTSASNYASVTWTSDGTGIFNNANSLMNATYTPSAADIAAGSCTLTLTATGNSPCGNAVSSKILSIKAQPSATIFYAGSPYCTSLSSAQAVARTGMAGGTYSASPSGLSIDAATGAITPSTSIPQPYTVIYTMAAGGACSAQTAVTTVIILSDGSWTGAINNDWNNPANWACNQLPNLATDVAVVSGLANYPILSSGNPGMSKDITIATGASVTVIGNTLQIAGAISNTGAFDATTGTIEMIGESVQSIGASVFSGNTIMNLKINNLSGVTLLGPLSISGVVSPVTGNLSSNGHLTLLSTVSQTALIDGVGTGNIVDNVNIQRYLSSSFGYKYFSSPFQSAKVEAFATLINLTETFPSFYKYDENNSILNNGVTSYKSGWAKYTTATDPLIPMVGYTANLGSTTSPKTFTMSGVVNNGPVNLTLYSHDREYTKGFNLVGNPYPSPINWNAPGWIKTNIDDAIYFFNAGNTDRYTGTYTSYVNKVSTGNANNIIAAMQGFFVHVTDGSYPVTATLGVTNAVRENTLNPVFKRAMIDPRPTMRLTAGFEITNAIEDAAVVYFDPTAHAQFEKEKDALKLENTDELVPNIYTMAPDSRKLSINGLSEPSDSVSFIPVGITTLRDGVINFRAEDADDLPFMQVYLADAMTGKYHDLRQSPDVRFSLQRGVYDNRFKLIFSKAPYTGRYPGLGKLFTVVRSGNRVLVKVDLPDNSKGYLLVTNLLGQTIMRREVSGKQTVEINQSITTGVYVITLVSGKRTESEKILMRTDYE